MTRACFNVEPALPPLTPPLHHIFMSHLQDNDPPGKPCTLAGTLLTRDNIRIIAFCYLEEGWTRGTVQIRLPKDPPGTSRDFICTVNDDNTVNARRIEQSPPPAS